MMKALMEGFPEQFTGFGEAVQLEALDVAQYEGIKQVVLLGLGGSGIAGDLVFRLTEADLRYPFQVVRDYSIPGYVNEDTLFIASSFSGNTEETLTGLAEAERRGAKIACVTGGGKLLAHARNKNYNRLILKAHAPCPRAHMGYSMMALLYFLGRVKVIPNSYVKDAQAAGAFLESERIHIQAEALRLADNFAGKLPVLYASTRLAAMTLRWQQQINENAKQFCHINVFPEMNHNELVGWQFPEALFSLFSVLLFRSRLDHPKIRARMDICKQVFSKKAKVYELEGKGKNHVEELLYFLSFGDWLSYYLAQRNHVDPFPVDIINHLKAELEQNSPSKGQ